jgi:competence protein ComEC
MPLALLGSALVVPAPGAGGALLRLSADVVAALLALLRLAGDLRFSVWQPPAAGAPVLWLAGVAAMLLSWWRPLPLRSLALALLLPVVAGSAGPRPPLRVTVLDVGQGLAVLVETPRHALLYDAGPLFRLRDAGESVVVPAIRRTGIRRLDAMMISHDDQDHAGGAPAVLRAFPDATLIAPAGLRLRSKESRRCVAGLSWAWDGVFFTVISPGPADAARSENDGSCVLRIETRNFSVLLPGDIGRRREEELAGRGRLHAVDLLVAPHHGSRSSSGSALVAATRPRFVVVSAGHRNRWGFPAGEVRERWARSGACLLETAAAGAITFAIGDDGTFRLVRRERVDGARLWTSDAVPGDPCPDTPGH